MKTGSSRNKKVLITGAAGMLGSAFVRNLKEGGYNVRALDHIALDVQNLKDIDTQAEFKPDWIIHTAGIVNADYCEEYRSECFKSHFEGTKNIIALAKKTGAKLFYPQSFLIFDGKEEPITEETKPNPICIYGEAKLQAEQAVLKELPDALVVRMGGFFGGLEKDKNFVGKFALHLKKKLSDPNPSVLATDREWQPTYIEDLAKNCILLMEQDKTGIYNMASHGVASFYDIADLMIKNFNLQSRIKLEKVGADYFPEKAKRPQIAVMENRRLKEEGLDMMRPWKEALSEYLGQEYFLKIFRS